MEQLPWLPQHPDLGAALAAARREGDPAARLAAAARLAGFRRDFLLTGRIDRLAAGALEGAAAENAGLMPRRLAILGSHTVDHLLPGIRVAGLARRMAVSVHVGAYGMYRQSLLDEDPELAAFAPQFVLLALDAHDTPADLPLDASEAEAEAAVSARVNELRLLWRRARERFSARVIQQTVVPAEPPVFGSFEALVPGAPGALAERLNAAIRAAARADGVLLLDLASHAARTGFGEGLADPVRWHQAKQLVSPLLAPLYGDLLARVVAAASGLSRKCLVLDLDNTLWGGVVGDDGMDGLHLGQGSPEGEAFLAFQRHAARLARRGVILAVCSKNDLAVAEAAFTDHPEMALKRADIAAFVANWDDKAGNIRGIARTLNIGLDSLVFVDDNPAERDIVRRELPEVAVPELPEDVAHYPARLADAGYFEAASFTVDDAARARAYALNSERRAALDQASDMEGYLRGLEMVMLAAPIGAADLARSAQLTNKTNQFNLTTVRRTEAELERLLGEPGAVGMSVRLRDRFGDNGLIAVVLARPDPAWPADALLIDTWLMSCRVLGRGAEAATLGALAAAAGARGARALVGEYRPSARNGMVANHYGKLGFAPVPAPAGANEGATFWRYEIGAGRPPAHHIDVRSAQ